MNKKLSPQQNNQPFQPNKKLQKQRQRILKELEEAQQAQAEALERFHRAEARLQKRTADLQRIAAQLLFMHQQLGEPAGSIPLAVSMPTGERAPILEEPSVEGSFGRPVEGLVGGSDVESTGHVQETSAGVRDDELPAAAEHTEEIPQASQAPKPDEGPEDEIPVASQHRADMLQPEAEIPTDSPGAISIPQPSRSPAEAAEFAREARAVAEATEQAAREAAERAVAAAAHLEQVGSGGRHLLQELQQLQTEAEQANAIAQQAERAAREAEAAAGIQFIALTDAQGPTPDTESVGVRFIAPGDGEGSPPELAAGEEEETIVEPRTETMVAEVAAAAAAEAEAVAEASSARTREAHRFAQQADQVLEDARAAIRNGQWSGEDAEQYLQALELEATRAHALLADAEAAEEQAQRAASSAEAEAEVAEGIAFTSISTADDQVETSLDDQPENDESDATLKMRIVKKDED